MSTPEGELPELSREIQDLLALERAAVAPSAAKARVLGKVLVAVGAGAGALAAGAAEGATSATGAGASAGATGATLGAVGSAKLIGVVAFLVGVVAGGVGVEVLRPTPEPTVVYVDRPVPAPAPAPVLPPPAAPAPPAPPPLPRAKLNPPPPPQVAPAPPNAAHSREQALVERARAALGRGQVEDARAALDEHERTFPSGRFVEEREGLRALVLWAAGREEEARAQARRFLERYPNSLLRGAIEARIR